MAEGTAIQSTLAEEARAELEELSRANLAQARRYPGDRPDRQPIHTVYGGAQLFRADTSLRLGELAIASLAQYAPDAFAFAEALRLPGHEALPRDADAQAELGARFGRDPAGLRAERPDQWLPLATYDRVLAKLRREPVEDFRIDFEDGFGVRPDAEEDETARRCAREVARGLREGSLPPFLGIRIKTFNEELKGRAVRTLDLFVSELVAQAGKLPDNFVVTLPKITVPEQPRTLVRLFERLERRLNLPAHTLKLEMMVELTQSIVDAEGRSNLPRLLDACEGRCTGAHFGTYDYTASCDITALWQAMDHPLCQYALHSMKNALAGTGVFLSDGATNVMPVGPHRAPPGERLDAALEAQNVASVHAAWRLMYGHVRLSLKNGFYQGWDLHPAQLPVRYAACYAFFLEGFEAAAARLKNFVDKAAQATLVGDVFDDAATGQGLLNYFLRGLSAGAVSEGELALTGLTLDEVRSRSFVKILAGRTQR
ncbi:MAG: phosphoenolpyruvate kinase [Polyangiaceae bacterium]|nr:phosphoenolpyruvate kinase [Polyangiaceae bacterium]